MPDTSVCAAHPPQDRRCCQLGAECLGRHEIRGAVQNGSHGMAKFAVRWGKVADVSLAADAGLAAAEHGEQERCDTDFTTAIEPLLTIQQREERGN